MQEARCGELKHERIRAQGSTGLAWASATRRPSSNEYQTWWSPKWRPLSRGCGVAGESHTAGAASTVTPVSSPAASAVAHSDNTIKYIAFVARRGQMPQHQHPNALVGTLLMPLLMHIFWLKAATLKADTRNTTGACMGAARPRQRR